MGPEMLRACLNFVSLFVLDRFVLMHALIHGFLDFVPLLTATAGVCTKGRVCMRHQSAHFGGEILYVQIELT